MRMQEARKLRHFLAKEQQTATGLNDCLGCMKTQTLPLKFPNEFYGLSSIDHQGYEGDPRGLTGNHHAK